MAQLSRFSAHFVALCALIGVVGGCTPPANDAAPSEPADTVESVSASAMETGESMEAAEAMSEEAPDEAAAEPAEEEVDRSIQAAEAYDDNGLLEGLTPEGYKQAGDIEHYNVAALYDKIDGRSELYMSYDVVGLGWVSYVQNDDPNDFIDVFMYDMRATTTAYGIYSVEREVGQPKADLGREGYRTDSNFYFWKGRFYGYIQCSKNTEAAQSAAFGVAKGILDRIEDTGDPVIGLDLVPTDGIIEDSVQFFRTDAMSLDFMTGTFIARYGTPEVYTTAFMTKRATTEEAADIVEQYKGYLTDYGDNVETVDMDGTPVTIGDLGGGYFDGVFHLENTVGGVSSVEGRDDVVAAAKAQIERLKSR